MKLTITIDTTTASPAAIQALKALIHEIADQPAQADPLADHPELPLKTAEPKPSTDLRDALA